jgi:hypothetical protein
LGEFGECGGEAPGGRGVDGEFIVAAAEVLDEGVSGDDDLGCDVCSQAPHRSEPVLEPAVIGFDRVVGVLLDVMPRGAQQLIDDGGGRSGRRQ